MYTVTTEKIPIKIWATHLEDNSLEQAKNLANLAFSYKWIALMADAHLGYGMPIGGVLATKHMVVPNAVGVDIGCGMKARKTNVKNIDTETLKKILNQIQRDVPTGFAHHKHDQELPEDLVLAAEAYVQKEPALTSVFAHMGKQLGTLGGGNHFIEIQTDEDGYAWVMLHSGSRGIGQMVCTFYNKIAEEEISTMDTETHDLAGLSLESAAGKNYMLAMSVAMKFAEYNRSRMLEVILQAIKKYYPDMTVEEAIDTHHNYASLETHDGEEILIHRKGAVRAEGKVIIPGSMGSYSYIAEGLANPESFCSCSHGAGRVMGRKEARATFSVQTVIEDMKAKNIQLFKRKKDDVAEESVGAYKDLDEVMEAQKDLVTPLVRLKPVGVVKG